MVQTMYLILRYGASIFLEAQGCTFEHNIMHQDNQSCTRLKIIGALSTSGRNNNIKSRYYYITNNIEDEDIEVKYCPTDEMWVDMLTKPKQGTPCKKDRTPLPKCAYRLRQRG